jgi:thiol-disulfide isomerase/thioredoxin
MRPEQTTPARVWTVPRALLASLVFLLLAAAFSQGCGPADDTRSTNSAPAATPAPAARDATPRPPGAPNPAAMPAANPESLPAALLASEMTDLSGRKFKLSDYSGKLVVMNLWATWCGPCRQEIPDFVELHAEYKGRDVVMLGVTMEDERNTKDQIEEFAKDFGIEYRNGLAERDLYVGLLQPGFQIPQTYVLSRDGRVLKKFLGYNPEVVNNVRSILNQMLGQ